LHQDQEFLDDVKLLERYVTEELNVRDLVLTSEESQYGVEYAVQADVKNLGIKFKKDASKIKAALPKLSAADIHAFLEQQTLTVEGHQLSAEDLRVQRGLKANDANKNFEPKADGDVMVLLDAFAYPELAQEGLAREVLNRIQRLRKSAGLVPTDDVQVLYSVLAPAADEEAAAATDAESARAESEKQVEKMFAHQSATFVKAASHGIVKQEATVKADGAVAEEETNVKDIRLLLRLLKV